MSEGAAALERSVLVAPLRLHHVSVTVTAAACGHNEGASADLACPHALEVDDGEVEPMHRPAIVRNACLKCTSVRLPVVVRIPALLAVCSRKKTIAWARCCIESQGSGN